MTLRVLHTASELRAEVSRLRGAAGGAALGFVPTMGALHHGHLTLMRRAAAECEHLIVSIFVNPTQFGPGEDLDRYPRQLQRDLEAMEAEGLSALVFAPGAEELYPAGDQTRVVVHGVSEGLCGPHRPGHFSGVATVVTKLFSIVGPCRAYFGRKDYQQVQVIKRLVTDLLLPIQIVDCPTVREDDGLAMSSRNRYLSAEQRAMARAVPRALSRAHAAFAAGERDPARLAQLARTELDGFDSLDYVSVVEPDTLVAFEGDVPHEGRALLAIAARLGATRLIDNLVLGEEPPPVTP